MSNEAKVGTLPEAQTYCGLVLDEMKVKESLVYDKYTGGVTGFTNVGNINADLLQLERDCQGDNGPAPVATHLLVLMVRGLFFKLNFPFAHFATTGVTADLLFPIVWEAIRLIESIGLKVICITADGASPNRKFFRMHRGPDDASPTFKTRNPFAQEERCIYFICDPPHLIKTTRNCWSHSGWNGTRHMTVSVLCIYMFAWVLYVHTHADTCDLQCIMSIACLQYTHVSLPSKHLQRNGQFIYRVETLTMPI